MTAPAAPGTPGPVCGRCDRPMRWAGRGTNEDGQQVTWHMCDVCGRLHRLHTTADPSPADQPTLFPDQGGM